MSPTNEVLCNHPLFGEHRGETYQTGSLDAVFPGARYEITASGRLELLVCNYEDHSDPDAEGIARFFGGNCSKACKERFEGRRRDLGIPTTRHPVHRRPGFLLMLS